MRKFVTGSVIGAKPVKKPLVCEECGKPAVDAKPVRGRVLCQSCRDKADKGR